jgi:hypothetical protein
MEARLSDHFDHDVSSRDRVSRFSREWNAGASHTIVSLQADMKPEAIDRRHRRFFGVDARKFLGEQHKRILVVGVHMLNDLGH